MSDFSTIKAQIDAVNTQTTRTLQKTLTDSYAALDAYCSRYDHLAWQEERIREEVECYKARFWLTRWWYWLFTDIADKGAWLGYRACKKAYNAKEVTVYSLELEALLEGPNAYYVSFLPKKLRMPLLKILQNVIQFFVEKKKIDDALQSPPAATPNQDQLMPMITYALSPALARRYTANRQDEKSVSQSSKPKNPNQAYINYVYLCYSLGIHRFETANLALLEDAIKDLSLNINPLLKQPEILTYLEGLLKASTVAEIFGGDSKNPHKSEDILSDIQQYKAHWAKNTADATQYLANHNTLLHHLKRQSDNNAVVPAQPEAADLAAGLDKAKKRGAENYDKYRAIVQQLEKLQNRHQKPLKNYDVVQKAKSSTDKVKTPSPLTVKAAQPLVEEKVLEPAQNACELDIFDGPRVAYFCGLVGYKLDMQKSPCVISFEELKKHFRTSVRYLHTDKNPDLSLLKDKRRDYALEAYNDVLACKETVWKILTPLNNNNFLLPQTEAITVQYARGDDRGVELIKLCIKNEKENREREREYEHLREKYQREHEERQRQYEEERRQYDRQREEEQRQYEEKCAQFEKTILEKLVYVIKKSLPACSSVSFAEGMPDDLAVYTKQLTDLLGSSAEPTSEKLIEKLIFILIEMRQKGLLVITVPQELATIESEADAVGANASPENAAVAAAAPSPAMRL